MNGRIPKMLLMKMKKNSEVRNGRYRSPLGPMTSSTIPLRMNSTTDSIPFCRPDGTSLGRRKAITNSPITMIADRTM